MVKSVLQKCRFDFPPFNPDDIRLDSHHSSTTSVKRTTVPKPFYKVILKKNKVCRREAYNFGGSRSLRRRRRRRMRRRNWRQRICPALVGRRDDQIWFISSTKDWSPSTSCSGGLSVIAAIHHSNWTEIDGKDMQHSTLKSAIKCTLGKYGSVALLWHNAKVLVLLKVKCEIH